MNILVTIPVNQDVIARFEETAPGASFRYVREEDVTREDITETDILIGYVSPELIQASPRLKLFQLNLAGANTYCLPGILHEDTILCNSTGAYGVAVSEHMLASIFALTKKLNRYECNRKKHLWRDEGSVLGIFGSTTLVIGAGDIGSEFGKRMAALGSRVIGIRRHKVEPAPYMVDSGTMGDIDRFLPEADFIACSLPATPETNRLFDAERIGRMKQTAIIANVGRGTLFDQQSLAEALMNYKIGGACLDVTDPEPLPKDSPLWDCPNLILTPHVAGYYHLHYTYERIVDIAMENLRRYLNGEELMNLIDRKSGYREFRG
ncbi:MAG: D-2-hydroxyacid dehydrogenase [Lachnospiraceae bacterium]|nr:D-2-hydroxyacid dehydrogenase [Lachnospiraceae bacterium]